MTAFTLVTTDIEGETYEHDCMGYERQSVTGLLRVFVDGQEIVELTPDDYGGGPLVLIDYMDEEDTGWPH